MRLEHSFVQREDATAHLSHLETGQGLAVDFHPAVKHIDLGEQLALRTRWASLQRRILALRDGKESCAAAKRTCLQGAPVPKLRQQLPVHPLRDDQGAVLSPNTP